MKRQREDESLSEDVIMDHALAWSRNVFEAQVMMAREEKKKDHAAERECCVFFSWDSFSTGRVREGLLANTGAKVRWPVSVCSFHPS